MSKERELLTKVLKVFDSVYSRNLIKEIEELLAQPEPEPVAWIDAGSLKALQESTGFALRYLTNDTENLNVDDVPLYLAPPQREPLNEVNMDKIIKHIKQDADFSGVMPWQICYIAHLIEQQHGIGAEL